MLNCESMPLAMIDMVKRHLHITWSDEDTDERLAREMASAELAICHKLGAACDVTAPGQVQNLYLAYILYAWNGSLNEFDRAYTSEILQLRHIHAVRKETYDPMTFKSRFSTYNDGVLYICQARPKASSISAVINPTRTSDMVLLQKLDYTAVTKRERDLAFAQAAEKSLDLKVKTRFHRSANTSRQVLIGTALYDIFQLDTTSDQTEMFLYLEKVRDLING